MDPILQEYILLKDAETEVEVLVKLRNPSAPPPQLRIITQFGDIATCRILVKEIQETWNLEDIVSIKAPRVIGLDQPILLDQPTESVRTRENATGYSGRNTVIGIIDWGFDFTHPNFIDPKTGKTRFLAIWDQSKQGKKGDNIYGYGKIYTQEDINAALQSVDPFNTLGHNPQNSDSDDSGTHATHVLDIAAGNGTIGEKGYAYEAVLIGVQLHTGNISFLNDLGSDSHLLEAIDFLDKTAAKRPLAINMSVGRHGGNHQGLSLVEQGMDAFLLSKSGRAIVNSVGNYYSSDIHTSDRIKPLGLSTFNWEVQEGDKTPNELEIWYPGKDQFQLEISFSQENYTSAPIQLGENSDIILNDDVVIGRAYHRKNEPNTGFNHIDIFLYTKAPHGAWEITLKGINIVDGRYHAWVERDNGSLQNQSHVEQEKIDRRFTTGSICNGFYTISVGAYDPSHKEKKVGTFSSSGPTVDGRIKPHLLAPGVGILAARSAPITNSKKKLTQKSGSSMAAPHVTGAVALLFEKQGTIPVKEVHRLLLSNLAPLYNQNEDEQDKLGFGYLNIEKLLDYKVPNPVEIQIETVSVDTESSSKCLLQPDVGSFNCRIAPHQSNEAVEPFSNPLSPYSINSNQMTNFSESECTLHPEMESCDCMIHLEQEAYFEESLSDFSKQTSEATLPTLDSKLARKLFDSFVFSTEGTTEIIALKERYELVALPQNKLDYSDSSEVILIQRNYGEGTAELRTLSADNFESNYNNLKINQLAIKPKRLYRLSEQSSPQLLRFRIKNKVLINEAVSGCLVSLVGNGINQTAASNRFGNVSIDSSNLPNGNYTLTASPTDTYTGDVGPSLVTANQAPNRVWRPFSTTIELRNGAIIPVIQPDFGRLITSTLLHTIALQPVWIKSPNFSARPSTVTTNTIIIHHTAGPVIGPALNWFLHQQGPSAHYVIDTDGQIIKMVKDSDKSWHAGHSYWAGRRNVNNFSIGIEIVHRDGAYPQAQYTALLGLLSRLTTQLSIPTCNIIGHSDIATNSTAPYKLGRKSSDPGLHFNWDILEQAGFGLHQLPNPQPTSIFGGFYVAFPDGSLRQGDNDAQHRYGGRIFPQLAGIITSVQEKLSNIGYWCPVDGDFSPTTALTVQMFKEHFMSRNGTLDSPTTNQIDFDTAALLINVVPCLQAEQETNIINNTQQNNLPNQYVETVDVTVTRFNALKQSAATNTIRTIHQRISRETGLTHPSLPDNPLIGISENMIRNAYNAHVMHGASTPSNILMALWKKEGSDQQNRMTQIGLNGFSGLNEADTRSIFRSQLYFIEMGLDHFVHFVPQSGSDNRASFSSPTDARNHEIAFRASIRALVSEGFLQRDISNDINTNLITRRLGSGRFEIRATNHFYIYSLLLADAFYRKNSSILASALGTTSPDLGLVYMQWNMGATRMNQFIQSANRHRLEAQYLTNGTAPSIETWAFEQRALDAEWQQPRWNAIKFRYFAEVLGHIF